MKTRMAFGPFMKLVITLAAQRADEALKNSEHAAARAGNCLRLLKLLAASQTMIQSEDRGDIVDASSSCFRLNCNGT